MSVIDSFGSRLQTSSDFSRVWFPALQSLCGNSKIGPRIGPRPGGPVAKRYGPGTWLTLLGFRFCPKARGNAGKVNKDELLSASIFPLKSRQMRETPTFP